MNLQYDTSEDGLIRTLFMRGEPDERIADRLRRYSGRECRGEAIRKRRRVLGLKKQPGYGRWTWEPKT